ncbi:hypothetical protein [Streptomyces sp. NPDC058677]|uniref:hypothetical protein n=2 Tax=Streptomyces TaxID=1883 RepID=UPI003657EFC4
MRQLQKPLLRAPTKAQSTLALTAGLRPRMSAVVASNSRAGSAAWSAGRPVAAASSSRAAPAAPSAGRAGSGRTPGAENTVPPSVAAAHLAVSPFAARIVVFVTGIPHL